MEGKSSKQYSLFNLIESLSDVVLVIDPDGIVRRARGSLAGINGLELAALAGKRVSDLNSPLPENLVLLLSELFSRVKGACSAQAAVIEPVAASRMGLSISANPDMDENGGIRGVIVVIREETAGEKLREFEQLAKKYFRQLADLTPFPVSIIDQRGNYLFINRRFTETFGYTLEEIATGRDWFRLSFPDPRARSEAVKWWKSDLASVQAGSPRTRFFHVRAKDGSEKAILFHPVTMPDGNQMITYQDLTMISMVQEERIKERKLESQGAFAAGVANQFNNLLTAIMGNISLAMMEEGLDPNVRDLAMNAQKACSLAVEVTGKLLDYASKSRLKLASVKAKDLIESIVGELRYSLKIQWSLQLPIGLWDLNVEPEKIRDAVTNIILNAAESMPSGGMVKITARNLECMVNSVAPPLEPGRYLELSISDQGAGIPDSLIPRLFDPFFTTKFRNTGMGLPIAFAVVKRHGGTITVDSRPGEGSSFHVYLPAAGQDSRQEPDDREESAAPSQDRGREALLPRDHRQ